MTKEEAQLLSALQQAIKALEIARIRPAMVLYTTEDTLLMGDVADPLDFVLAGVGDVGGLDVCVESRGGATEVPVLVVALIRGYAAEFDAIVAGLAHSAATSLVLGANNIVMTRQGQLGPTDPARRHPLLPKPDGQAEGVQLSVHDLRRSMEFVRRELGEGVSPDVIGSVITALFDKVHPMAIGAIEQSYELAKQVGRNNLATHMTDAAEIDRIVDELTDGYNAHSYPIMRAEARRLGLPIIDAEPWLDAIGAVHTAARAFVRGEESVSTAAPADYQSPRRRRHAVFATVDRAAYAFSVRAAKKPSARPEVAVEWLAESGWIQIDRTGGGS